MYFYTNVIKRNYFIVRSITLKTILQWKKIFTYRKLYHDYNFTYKQASESPGGKSKPPVDNRDVNGRLLSMWHGSNAKCISLTDYHALQIGTSKLLVWLSYYIG